MRRLIPALVVLLLLVVVADRAGAAYAGRAVARELQAAAALPEQPGVDVRGVPFLTQAVVGRYQQVDLRARDVPAGEVVFRELDATLTGVRAPLDEVLGGTLTTVSVERVDGRVLLPYAALSQRSGGRQLTVTPAGDRVRVEGSVRVLGRTLTAAATSVVTLEGDDVVVTAQSFDVGNEVADRAITLALAGRLDLRMPTGDLPYGLQLDGLAVEPDGVRLSATARDVVVTAP